jgi:NADPH:quinone reductase-like Zn-dependent oxidoreductase
MQAIISTKSGLKLREIDKPVPGEYEVLIKVRTATVTAGDVVLGNLPGFMYWSPVRKALVIPPKKRTPGHEFAGVIEATGKYANRFKVGNPVFGTTTGLVVGANAEYVCLPESWENGVITLKPSNITYEQAAAIPLGSMTAQYLRRKAIIQPGDKVLVYGASGSVGTYAVQLAKHLGTKVTGVCGTRNVGLVTSLGADKVIDYTTGDFTQYSETYDVIFDAVGKISSAQRKRLLRQNGRYTSIRSSTHETSEALAFIKELVEAGMIKPVIDRSYTLAQITDAYAYVGSGRKAGNVVIQIAD